MSISGCLENMGRRNKVGTFFFHTKSACFHIIIVAFQILTATCVYDLGWNYTTFIPEDRALVIIRTCLIVPLQNVPLKWLVLLLRIQ
jgi:hypothetical protein